MDEVGAADRGRAGEVIIHRLVQHVAFSLREAGELEREKELIHSFEPLLSSLEDAEERSNDHPPIR